MHLLFRTLLCFEKEKYEQDRHPSTGACTWIAFDFHGAQNCCKPYLQPRNGLHLCGWPEVHQNLVWKMSYSLRRRSLMRTGPFSRMNTVLFPQLQNPLRILNYPDSPIQSHTSSKPFKSTHAAFQLPQPRFHPHVTIREIPTNPNVMELCRGNSDGYVSSTFPSALLMLVMD